MLHCTENGHSTIRPMLIKGVAGDSSSSRGVWFTLLGGTQSETSMLVKSTEGKIPALGIQVKEWQVTYLQAL